MCSFCQQTNKKEAVKKFFCIADFFSSVLKLVKLQQQITVKKETEQTNKQTDKKKKQKNSTMIDDRRLLKPANEKNKQKNTEIFPQCLHTTTLILLHKIKKINSKKTYK